MKTFNEKDLITWSNHDKAIIGKLYYFGYWLESIQSKIETGIGDRLVSINNNSFVDTFKNECGYHYPCILPVDAVKDIEPEKKYRACKNIREFYRVLLNELPPLNWNTEEDFIYDLIDRDIHFRSKKTGTKYYSSIRSISEDVNGYIKVLIAWNNYLSFDELFSNYEIEINGEWKPVGILDD